MLELKNITKTYDNHIILDNLSITFPDTGFIGIKGKSGCGKTTLLYILGMLDTKYEGEILYNGKTIEDPQSFIQKHISFIMQSEDYITSLSVSENINLAAYIADKQVTDIKTLSQQLHINHLLHQKPSSLSGGELKRMTIAKALNKQSSILLCDEPTGALDYKNSLEVMQLLQDISQERLVIIVSHNEELLNQYCDHILILENQKLNGNIPLNNRKAISENKTKKSLLWFYPIRQLLYHKKKYIGLFIMQWIITICFILMLTLMNGIIDMIDSYTLSHPLSSMVTIENTDKKAFTSLKAFKNYQYADYTYDLSYLQSDIQIDTYNYLPHNTEHIKLIKGQYPSDSKEILVSETLYKTLNKDTLTLHCNNESHTYIISGIIKDHYIPTADVYLTHHTKKQYKDLINQHVISIEIEPHLIKETIQSLNKDYITYNDIYTMKESYSTLLNTAKTICYIFMIINICISLLLISVVFSIVFYERRHDIAYLYSLGMNKQRMHTLFTIETFLIGSLLFIGGTVLSVYIVNLINESAILSKYNIVLTYKSLIFYKYDIYIILGILYSMTALLSSIRPINNVLKQSVIEELRKQQ